MNDDDEWLYDKRFYPLATVMSARIIPKYWLLNSLEYFDLL